MLNNMEKDFRLRVEADEPLYNCGDGAVMLLYGNADEDEYNSYAERLKGLGCSLYQETETGTVLSRTFKCSCGIICAVYSACRQEIRIIRDTNTAEYLTEESFSPRCATELYQFEVDHSLIDCGMCYIIRCADNSFFVIDSAHVYSVHDDIRILDFLKRHTPGGEKPRVAGWFFSHGHIDHTGKFMDVLVHHRDELEIERIYCNTVPTDNRDSHFWMESDNVFADKFDALIEESDIPVVRLHTGQSFAVRNLRFDVLCTHEDVYPQSLENYNDSSTVLMMTANGSRVLFPGDAGAVESEILENSYGKCLKCDIIQVAHHGHFGTSPRFYRLADADTALFPTTQIKFDEDLPRYEANRLALKLSSNYYIASNGTVRLPLPYDRDCISVLPDETFEDFDGIFGLWAYEYTDERKAKLYRQYLGRGGKPIEKYTYLLGKRDG